jgi:hypothetical protein
MPTKTSALVLTVLIALLVASSAAAASEPEGPCSQPALGERESCQRTINGVLCADGHEEACRTVEAEHAAKVSKAAEEALEEGEGGHCVVLAESAEQGAEVLARCRALLAEKIAAAWSEPVSLDVAVEAHKGHSAKTPGYTTLGIWASQFAHVRFVFSRHGHRSYDYVADHPGAGEAVEWRPFRVAWSCNSPGGIYAYTVEAWTGKSKLVKRGHFKPASTEWCRTAARHEREALERKDRQWREVAEREHAAFVREEHEAEENCRKLGGTVVTIHGDAGPVRVCRSPEAYVPL